MPPPDRPVARALAAATRTVGGFEVVALLDGAGPFTLVEEPTQAFPGATPGDWQAARRLDPAAFAPGGEWVLSFRCYAVRRPGGRTVLVDAGIGPHGSLASSWAPVPGRLPGALAAAGIDVDDVDQVVLTHLHGDHVGWAVEGDGTPRFPGARYVVQRAEIAALGAEAPARVQVVEPLRRHGQLHEVEGRAQVAGAPAGRVRVVPTPGHTVGHQSVVVEGGGDEVVLAGDVLVHAVQVVDPDVPYALEHDRDEARRTRRALLAGAARRRALVGTAHLTAPFVELAAP